ncbi:hypothetical protein BV20DRAFT_747682 [Pilatotrama ljubarskyi]|nr:hypothetical protein BV20DRAFT_747682 [Pilatotrama ljubarskyi]
MGSSSDVRLHRLYRGLQRQRAHPGRTLGSRVAARPGFVSGLEVDCHRYVLRLSVADFATTRSEAMASAQPQPPQFMYHQYPWSTHGITDRLPCSVATVRLYEGLCPFCPPPLNLPPESSYGNGALSQYRIIPLSLRGEAELAWLKATNLAPHLSTDSLDNIIPVCSGHNCMLSLGRVVLCPPLCDLETLLEWEKTDWDRRLHENVPRPRVVPPADRLSGDFSCLWTVTIMSGRIDNLAHFQIHCTHLARRLSGPVRLPVTYPQHVQYIPDTDASLEDTQPVSVKCRTSLTFADILKAKEDGRPPPRLELLLHFNVPGEPPRVCPFATLVRALAVLGDAGPPPVLFYAGPPGADGERSSLPVENPAGRYRELLRELRDLYSRTGADLAAQ